MKKRMLYQLMLWLSVGGLLVGCTSNDTNDAESAVVETESVEVVTESRPEVSTSSEDTEEVSASIKIVIDGDELTDLTKEVVVPEGTLLADVMQEEYDVVDEGGFISAIEGNEQDVEAQRYWMYYINDEMAAVGANEYAIRAGDVIEWRLEDSDF